MASNRSPSFRHMPAFTLPTISIGRNRRFYCSHCCIRYGEKACVFLIHDWADGLYLVSIAISGLWDFVWRF